MHAAAGAVLRLLRRRGFPFPLSIPSSFGEASTPVAAISGESVKSLDDRPALDVYLETLKAPPEASASREAFAAFAATHPLGIPRRDRIEIRYVAGADLETRSLTCIAGLPQGGMTMFI